MHKLTTLKDIVRTMESVLIAYSGGVDSSFLLHIAHSELEDRVLAVRAISPVYPGREAGHADALVQRLGVRQLTLPYDALANPGFAENGPERCYWCKKFLFGELKKIAAREGLRHIADGENSDDIGDYRPGERAARALGVRSPLREAGLTKQEIRTLSHEAGLPTWDKPSLACLASRIPYGTRISAEMLRQVDAAESFLAADLGLTQLRVRHHGPIARIEILPDDMPAVLAPDTRSRIVARLRELGFSYVTLDMAGYRTGSLNEVLPDAK